MNWSAQFAIESLGSEFTAQLRKKVDNKTKPAGALGGLEDVAIRVGRILRTTKPKLQHPQMLVFAADHGIAANGVSAYPAEVTQQMVLNFLNGGAAINVFCRLHGIKLRIIDAGVNGELPSHADLTQAKIGHGTRNFLVEPAMTAQQCQQALATGAAQVRQAAESGSNVIALGEMGIGNTSSAALLVHKLTGLPLTICVGQGTGLGPEGRAHKLALLQKAVARHDLDADRPLEILQTYGGFEIAMMCGAYLQAAQERMVILVDGFIASAAVLVAAQVYPALLHYCIFAHCSDEQGHKPLLEWLQVKPLLELNMRLGEGSGAALAFPLVQAAVAFLNEMASFDEASVSRESQFSTQDPGIA